MNFRTAQPQDLPRICEIIAFAKEARRQDGSQQWQDGYPNEATIESDIAQGFGKVVEENGRIIAYMALIFGEEPAYENIDGKWLTEDKYAVVHRIAVSKEAKGKGLGQSLLTQAEEWTLQAGIRSIKIDTNYDNLPMLRIIEKLGYTYCGEVALRGNPRKAFEKIIE